ncbi:hypothetical protein HK099_003556 [Clydaea vesicula]|uniref:WD40 repeat-like protein n=1 Tax=Clydaea vesicula TaxID=447962 RepID=A0AAD5Y079_9FUNG|nr:hypothetical protein HK099_003556 [Clydaea vesicula]
MSDIDENIYNALSSFPNLSSKSRKQFILALLSQMDPEGWRKVTRSNELWLMLFKNIGLHSMLSNYFKKDSPMKENVKRLHLLGNWVKGNFKRRSIQAHKLGVLAVSLYGEKHVATASADKSAKLFDIKSGLCLRHFVGHELPISCLQLDDFKLITGSADSNIKIWSLRDENCKATLINHKKSVTCLKFINQILISGSSDKTLKIWTLNETVVRANLATPVVNKNFNSLNIASKSVLHQQLVRTLEKNCNSVDHISPTCVRTLYGHDSGIKCLDFSLHIIVSGDNSGFVKIWHLSSGNCISTINLNILKLGLGNIKKIPFAPNENTEISTNLDLEKPEFDPISFIYLKDNRLSLGKFSGSLFLYDLASYKPWLKKSEFQGVSQFEVLKKWCKNVGTGRVVKNFDTNNPEEYINESNSGVKSWALCVQMDAWRLMCGVLWNHREGQRVYTLKGDTIQNGFQTSKLQYQTARDKDALENLEEKLQENITLEKQKSIAQLNFDKSQKIKKRNLSIPAMIIPANNSKNNNIAPNLSHNTKYNSIVPKGIAERNNNPGFLDFGLNLKNTSDEEKCIPEQKLLSIRRNADENDDPAIKSITGVAFDDRYIITSSMDGILRIWDCINN